LSHLCELLKKELAIVDYLILFFAVLCIAIQFNLNKFYQKKFADGLKDILFFPLVSGIVNFALFILISLGIYGKLPDFSVFSFIMAISLAIVSTLSALVGILVMKYGKMSVYSVFMMLGGMILPYFYGLIFLDETISIARIAGVVILICALPCSAVDPKNKEKAVSVKSYYILCVFIFILNGIVSILSKAHSVNISAIPAANFIVFTNIWGTVINGGLYFIFAPRFTQQKDREVSNEVNPNKFHAVLVITIYAVFSGVGFLLLLISAKTVPAVAMYPFITGGSIVLSTVLARIFYKEKIGRLATTGIIMSMAGTLLFLI